MPEHPRSIFTPEYKARLKAEPADAVNWGDIIDDLLLMGDPEGEDADVWEYAVQRASPEVAEDARETMARRRPLREALRARREQLRQQAEPAWASLRAQTQRIIDMLARVTTSSVNHSNYLKYLFPFLCKEYGWTPAVPRELDPSQAEMYLRAALEMSEAENQTPRQIKKRRGRPPDPDVEQRRRRTIEAWNTGTWPSYAALARELRIHEDEVRRTIKNWQRGSGPS
jgi:hypothetical protein